MMPGDLVRPRQDVVEAYGDIDLWEHPPGFGGITHMIIGKGELGLIIMVDELTEEALTLFGMRLGWAAKNDLERADARSKKR